MINKVKYSQQLVFMAKTYVVDGVCVKSRAQIPEDMTNEDIDFAIKNYENIGIQKDRQIDFYCDKEFNEDFEHYIKTKAIGPVKKAYEEGYIKLNVK